MQGPDFTGITVASPGLGKMEVQEWSDSKVQFVRMVDKNIYIIQGEINIVVGAIKRNARWSTHIPLDEERDPLLHGFSHLKEVLNSVTGDVLKPDENLQLEETVITAELQTRDPGSCLTTDSLLFPKHHHEATQQSSMSRQSISSVRPAYARNDRWRALSTSDFLLRAGSGSVFLSGHECYETSDIPWEDDEKEDDDEEEEDEDEDLDISLDGMPVKQVERAAPQKQMRLAKKKELERGEEKAVRPSPQHKNPRKKGKSTPGPRTSELKK
ncbi:hypothetical protein STEG23_038160 [Scotinomys teguina]